MGKHIGRTEKIGERANGGIVKVAEHTDALSRALFLDGALCTVEPCVETTARRLMGVVSFDVAQVNLADNVQEWRIAMRFEFGSFQNFRVEARRVFQEACAEKRKSVGVKTNTQPEQEDE